jgi:hypothetical protein
MSRQILMMRNRPVSKAERSLIVLERKQKPKGRKTEGETGIGMLSDGTLNVVNVDDPPFRPKIHGPNGNEIHMDLTFNPDSS